MGVARFLPTENSKNQTATRHQEQPPDEERQRMCQWHACFMEKSRLLSPRLIFIAVFPAKLRLPPSAPIVTMKTLDACDGRRSLACIFSFPPLFLKHSPTEDVLKAVVLNLILPGSSENSHPRTAGLRVSLLTGVVLCAWKTFSYIVFFASQPLTEEWDHQQQQMRSNKDCKAHGFLHIEHALSCARRTIPLLFMQIKPACSIVFNLEKIQDLEYIHTLKENATFE